MAIAMQCNTIAKACTLTLLILTRLCTRLLALEVVLVSSAARVLEFLTTALLGIKEESLLGLCLLAVTDSITYYLGQLTEICQTQTATTSNTIFIMHFYQN